MSGLIECWSCKSTVSLSDVSEADGLCPRCDAEIDLDGYRLAEIATLRTANQRLEALSVENIMLDVAPGCDGAGVEIYAQSVADVENKLTAMGDSLEFLEGQSVQLTAENKRLEGDVAMMREALQAFDDAAKSSGSIIGFAGKCMGLLKKARAALSTGNGEVTE